MKAEELSIGDVVMLFIQKISEETARQTANEIFEALARRPEDTWMTQDELEKKEGISLDTLRKMKGYGLTYHKEGKFYKYNLAKVNEIRDLMDIK